eukprot:2126488-Pyramimonas_sp.AAC.1
MRFMFARYLKPTPTFSSPTNIILESEGRPLGSREENSCTHLEFDEGVSELWVLLHPIGTPIEVLLDVYGDTIGILFARTTTNDGKRAPRS